MTTNERKSENDDGPASANTNFTDFSIDHILNRAGENCRQTTKFQFNGGGFESVRLSFEQFSWLQCTRYCPPKIPRNQRKEAPQRRQMGRHPRIPFTSQQLQILEEKFQQTPYLTGEQVMELAKQLQLADIRVKIWFQNRRARDRREKFSSESDQLTSSEIPKSTNSGVRSPPLFSTDFSAVSRRYIQQNDQRQS